MCIQIYIVHEKGKKKIYEIICSVCVNMSKMECRTTDKLNSNLPQTIYRKPIKQVSDFIYLDHKLSCKNDGFIVVQYRIGLGLGVGCFCEEPFCSNIKMCSISFQVSKMLDTSHVSHVVLVCYVSNVLLQH